MVNFCAIVNCGNRGGRDKKSFFRLPKVIGHQCMKTRKLTEDRRMKWLAVIGRSDLTENSLQYQRVCSDHFITGKPSVLFDNTNPDWAPTLRLGHDKISEASSTRDITRYTRRVERVKKGKQLDAAHTLLQLQVDSVEENVNSAEENDTGTAAQTDLLGTTVAAMQDEIQTLLTENRELKEKVLEGRRTLDVQFFEGDDENVRYYTGLHNFITLNTLYQWVEAHIPHNKASILTKFQQLILCLMKLRLNLAHMDIGQRFGINKSTVSRIFLNMVDVLYSRLKPLIVWPDREQLWESMPMSFRVHFGTKVAVIIDCFEVFIERPSNLRARAQTWSSYKHNNTVKFLIGITPQGSISYLSKGWGGRTSDKCITERSDFLNKLNPGDIVLADRGFDISDSVGMMGAELKIPAFTRGKKQLSGDEVETTRRIANVRIHVERVIGCLRQKYTMLCSTLPMEYMANDSKVTTLDKMAVICCALTNLCPSVVPLE